MKNADPSGGETPYRAARCLVLSNSDGSYTLVSFAPFKEWRIDGSSLWLVLEAVTPRTERNLLEGMAVRFPDMPLGMGGKHLDFLTTQGLLIKVPMPLDSGSGDEVMSERLARINIHIVDRTPIQFARSYLGRLFWTIFDQVCLHGPDTPAQVNLYYDRQSFEARPNLAPNRAHVLIDEAPTAALAAKADLVFSTSSAMPPHFPKWITLPPLALECSPLAREAQCDDLGAGYRIGRLTKRVVRGLFGRDGEKADSYPGSDQTVAQSSVVSRIATSCASAFSTFDHIACINLDIAHVRWAEMRERFRELSIEPRVERVSAVHTPEYHHTGCALSHRQVIESAWRQGYDNVLVFEDDLMMLPDAANIIASALRELNQVDWGMLYLGGMLWDKEYALVAGCRHLAAIPQGEMTCTHAVAYHSSMFEEILGELPDNEVEMEDWLLTHIAIDQALMRFDRRYLVVPKPFSQKSILQAEPAAVREHYQ